MGVYGDVWGSMVMCRGVWLCTGVYSVLQGYMVLYRGIWCFIGVSGDV